MIVGCFSFYHSNPSTSSGSGGRAGRLLQEVNEVVNAGKLEVLSDDCGVAVQPSRRWAKLDPARALENLIPTSRTFAPPPSRPATTSTTQLKMPSRGNPNVPNKERRLASRRKVQRKNAVNKVSKNPRGTARSSVLHPTGGPLAPISKKKARKVERAQNHARARAIEQGLIEEGETEMMGKCCN
jgi:hypothetical protein